VLHATAEIHPHVAGWQVLISSPVHNISTHMTFLGNDCNAVCEQVQNSDRPKKKNKTKSTHFRLMAG